MKPAEEDALKLRITDEIFRAGEWIDIRVDRAIRLAIRAAVAQERERSKAARDVLDERERQTSVEGWTPEHDDAHKDGSLAIAAACYALPNPKKGKRVRKDCEDVALRGEGPVYALVRRTYSVPVLWPRSWHPSWWKPKDRRRDLVRAAALIVAEIERLDRAAAIREGEKP